MSSVLEVAFLYVEMEIERQKKVKIKNIKNRDGPRVRKGRLQIGLYWIRSN